MKNTCKFENSIHTFLSNIIQVINALAGQSMQMYYGTGTYFSYSLNDISGENKDRNIHVCGMFYIWDKSDLS